MSDRFGLETALDMTGVPLDDMGRARFLHYVALLRSWQKAQNLVSRDTLKDVWTRHIADCLQLVPLVENAGLAGFKGVDLGSGAGLPGMLLALAGRVEGSSAGPQLAMTLIESNARKASFLRTVSRETETAVDVRTSRIEDANQPDWIDADFITARALAPLNTLAMLAEPWLSRGAVAFFHKGGEYARELDDWPDVQAYDVIEHVSVVDPNSRILQIKRQDVILPRPAP